MTTAAIIGAGDIGGAIAHALARRESANRVWLIDAAGSAAAGKALDIQQSGAIEGLGWSPRIAWLPAKLLAFALVSYPAQRLWVFAARSRA